MKNIRVIEKVVAAKTNFINKVRGRSSSKDGTPTNRDEGSGDKTSTNKEAGNEDKISANEDDRNEHETSANNDYGENMKKKKVMEKVKNAMNSIKKIRSRSKDRISTKKDDGSEGKTSQIDTSVNGTGAHMENDGDIIMVSMDNINNKASTRSVENYKENSKQNSNNIQNAANNTAGMDNTQITKTDGVKKEAEENPGRSIIESKRDIPNSSKASERLDNILETVNDDIQQATINTQLACSTLRSLYTINASSIEEFINFRRRVTKYARIYSDEVFPLASKIINYIQDFMENYSTLEFDEFKEVVTSLAEDARQKQEVALSVKKLHAGVGDDLRGEEDRISNLLKSLENEARTYKEKAESDKALVDSIANEEESKLAISAAFHVKNSLSIPIKNFVVSLTNITEFFDFFGKELESIADSSDDKQRDHYSRCREKANLIINNCRSYISAIPDCRADLAVIPDDYDKNYVKEWLSTKGAQHLLEN